MSVDRPRAVIVTGLSGSGKSTAIHVFEDLGFYCIDNMPVVLVPKFLEISEGLDEKLKRVAFGIDLRGGAFFDDLPGVVDQARAQGQPIEVLFLDASDEVVVRRFSETRRPHPFAEGGAPIEGIRRERDRLAPVRAVADRILDTTALTVHELRAAITRDYGDRAPLEGMTVFVQSFGFKHGVPTDADMVLDVRFLPNPFFVAELRASSGLEAPVAQYVLERPDAVEFLTHTQRLLDFLLPRYLQEGKTYLTVALGCTGGRHRSVALAEEIGRRLGGAGYRVQVWHRDVSR